MRKEMLICDVCNNQIFESNPRYILSTITTDGDYKCDLCSMQCLGKFVDNYEIAKNNQSSILPTAKWNDKFDLP